jgi:predicted O-linked N-acetylglucosamine transferase (SPINDLY family)
MNTSLQAFSVGAPVVTLPTPLHRGRHTHGMYRRMEIDACTARDPADYVRRAVELARNRDQREAVSALIRERNGVLYEDPRVVSEFERFFETAVAAAG